MKILKFVFTMIINLFMGISEIIIIIFEFAIHGWFVTIIIIALFIAWLLGAIPTF